MMFSAGQLKVLSVFENSECTVISLIFYIFWMSQITNFNVTKLWKMEIAFYRIKWDKKNIEVFTVCPFFWNFIHLRVQTNLANLFLLSYKPSLFTPIKDRYLKREIQIFSHHFLSIRRRGSPSSKYWEKGIKRNSMPSFFFGFPFFDNSWRIPY